MKAEHTFLRKRSELHATFLVIAFWALNEELINEIGFENTKE